MISKKYLTSFFLAAMICLWGGPSMADTLPGYSIAFGDPVPKAGGTLKGFDGSFMFGFGYRLPWSWWKDHQQTWVDFDWNRFKFHNSDYEHSSSPDSISRWGKDVSMWSLMAEVKIFPQPKNHIANYFMTLKLGLLTRSKSVIRTNSLERPYCELKYKLGPVAAGGVGLTLLHSDNLNFDVAIEYAAAYNSPGRTSYLLGRWSLIIK